MKSTFFFILFTSVFFGSCATFYTPSVQNVPLITSKGESNISFMGDGQVEDGAQLDLQFSHGITDKIAIASNFTLINRGDRYVGTGSSDVMQGGYYFLGQAGAGYFKQLKHHLVFETYGLMGLGQVENRQIKNSDPLDIETGSISSTLFRGGLQPNFGYKRKHWSVAASSGMYYLKYFNIAGDLSFDDTKYDEYLATNNSHLLLEPSITFKAGIKNIKAQLQYVYSYNIINPRFAQRNHLLSVGISFNFNLLNAKSRM